MMTFITWNELCTKVSSRSKARHFLPVPKGGGGLISGMRWGAFLKGLVLCKYIGHVCKRLV